MKMVIYRKGGKTYAVKADDIRYNYKLMTCIMRYCGKTLIIPQENILKVQRYGKSNIQRTALY